MITCPGFLATTIPVDVTLTIEGSLDFHTTALLIASAGKIVVLNLPLFPTVQLGIEDVFSLIDLTALPTVTEQVALAKTLAFEVHVIVALP